MHQQRAKPQDVGDFQAISLHLVFVDKLSFRELLGVAILDLGHDPRRK